MSQRKKSLININKVSPTFSFTQICFLGFSIATVNQNKKCHGQYNVGLKSIQGDSHYRWKMDPLETKIEGKGIGRKTVLLNISEVASQCFTQPQCNFFHFFVGNFFMTPSLMHLET